MRILLTALLVLAMLGVLATLFAGIFGLVTGRGDPVRSNQLMRWRVILQGVAIALFVLLLLALRD
ncbi:twin transmembrane helix small protein [Caldovatus aquaticus]|uniref:Twin transmembrane helix small protein n=1 Tax=Caldovatus aquaticus TaxID=2865671 RepID=A0ABS7F5P5_9PROT|nr:twin transmembrane helix small protein [Caldovatus aquaticus]MBW8270942.1 twin transmembrane helix small protein [Caldovatus aquaticus]